jgi:hypothetical protein
MPIAAHTRQVYVHGICLIIAGPELSAPAIVCSKGKHDSVLPSADAEAENVRSAVSPALW